MKYCSSSDGENASGTKMEILIGDSICVSNELEFWKNIPLEFKTDDLNKLYMVEIIEFLIENEIISTIRFRILNLTEEGFGIIYTSIATKAAFEEKKKKFGIVEFIVDVACPPVSS